MQRAGPGQGSRSYRGRTAHRTAVSEGTTSTGAQLSLPPSKAEEARLAKQAAKQAAAAAAQSDAAAAAAQGDIAKQLAEMKAAMDQTVSKLAAELAAHKEEGVVLKAELARMAPMVAQMELEKQVRSLLTRVARGMPCAMYSTEGIGADLLEQNPVVVDFEPVWAKTSALSARLSKLENTSQSVAHQIAHCMVSNATAQHSLKSTTTAVMYKSSARGACIALGG